MRRFRIEENASFEHFYVLLNNVFCKDLDLYHIKYVDSDGDSVTVSCTMELEEAIMQAKQISPDSPILRLSLVNRELKKEDKPDSVQVTVEYSPSRQRGSPFDLKIETITSPEETVSSNILIGKPNEPKETLNETSDKRIIYLKKQLITA